MVHFLIVQLGSQDLMEVALASIDRYAGDCNVDVVKLPDATTDPGAHGRAIDHWRRFQQVAVLDRDIVVIMDPDVILLSEQWRVSLDLAFADRTVGVWGAGNTQRWGPRVHAHMMAIRGGTFNTLERSFTPCLDLREQTWRDTGGLYCMWVASTGQEVRPVEQGPNWSSAAAWWDGDIPLWAHLGGGSHSDVSRLTWQQRLSPWRYKEIKKRRQFLADARKLLTS